MPTYILIHGAYQGGWIWKPVATRLRAAGHLVHAPTLDGCAERHHLIRRGITVDTHAREVSGLLFHEDLADVILVGTSSGGMVIQKAAELARARHRPLPDAERPRRPHATPAGLSAARGAVSARTAKPSQYTMRTMRPPWSSDT